MNKCYWSNDTLREMAKRVGLYVPPKSLQSLSVEERDNLGDHLFYAVNPQEKDHFPKRDVSSVLVKLEKFSRTKRHR